MFNTKTTMTFTCKGSDSKSLIRKIITLMLLALTAVMFSLPAMSVESLRGDKPLESQSVKVGKYKVKSEEGGYERNFKKQPPLIPHKVEKYRITLKNNGCLKCHSEKAYKKENAPKVGDSHYITRDGKTLKHISKRRYFCNQCHVPQVNSDPLVENTYENE